MYSVALVQNQSEMAHYGYADARPLLEDYEYRLFTGDNIPQLAGLLARREVDALVLGSNALNDREILDELCNPRFADHLKGFLGSGRGFLSFMQLGLAMRAGPALSVLPNPLGDVLPKVPPAGDTALTSGGIEFASGGA